MCTENGARFLLRKRTLAQPQRNHPSSALCEFMHGAARVCWAPFPTRAQHQHSCHQLRLRLCFGGHAGAFGEIMDLNILNAAENPIPTHAYAAFLAVILGAIQLSRPKGTNSHKYLGYSWVLLMLWVSVSSFWIQTIKIIGPFSPIHFLSIFTIWSVFEAIRSARNGNIIRHKRMMKLLYILALIVTGLFTLLPGRTMNAVLFGV